MAEVLGIKLYDLNIPAAYAQMLDIIQSQTIKKNRLISATGAHGLVTAQKDIDFKNTLNEYYLNLPDGLPGVWIGKLKGNHDMQVCAGPDFFEYVIKESNSQNIRHYFCGGQQGVANELKEVCINKFRNHNIAGTYSPPFREMTDLEMGELGNDIKNVNANIVWIGLSTPKQEKFAYRLKRFTSTQFIITVGAAFDFHTGRVKYAPSWMQNSGLGWLFRVFMEPKRLLSRYLNVVPLFIYYNFKELLSSFNSKKTKTVHL